MSQYGYIAHHGIKGQKWGVRRYQNEDGSLTSLGRNYYGMNERRALKQETKQYLANNKVAYRNARNELKEFNKNKANLLRIQERKKLKQNIKDIREDRRVVKMANKNHRQLYMRETDPEKKRQLGELLKQNSEIRTAEKTAEIGLASKAIDVAGKVGKIAITAVLAKVAADLVMNTLSDRYGIDDALDVVERIKDKIV